MDKPRRAHDFAEQSIVGYTSRKYRAKRHENEVSKSEGWESQRRKKISYLICTMEKYNTKDRDNITPIELENERDEIYKPKNPQIDLKRTKKNYHEVHPQGGYLDYIHKRIEELHLPRKPRKDAVLMCSFIIGSDRTFFSKLNEGAREAFFHDAAQFFIEKYGRENIISAVVHMDETNPHMHLNLVPIFGGKLCAKELFGPPQLRDLQTEFWKEVGEPWGLMRGKPGSQAVHLDTAEYKAKKILEKAQAEADKSDERKRKQDAEFEQKEAQMKEMEKARRCDERLIEQMSAQKEKLESSISQLETFHTAVEEAKEQPLPKRRKESEQEITRLRAENAAYRVEQKRLQREVGNLFQDWQDAERRAHRNEDAASAVRDMETAYPSEYKDLLSKSRRKLNPAAYYTPIRINHSGKDGK